MKKNSEDWEIIYFLLCLGVITLLMLLSGCGHNINVHGVGIACPYGAVGYGSFSCVKDNVTVERSEEPAANGIKTTNKFTVGKQTTGYDVELNKQKGGQSVTEK
jgi:hypothetical protein